MNNTAQTHNNLVKTLLIGGLTAIFAFIVGYIIYSYTMKAPTSDMTSTVVDITPQPPARASMHLDPDTLSVLPDETFTVDVNIDAKGTIINGADSVIVYDPSFIRVIDVEQAAEVPEDFMLLRELVENDRVILTFVRTNYTDIPTGQMTIARVTMRQLKPGVTSLTLEHKPGTTQGSTIIDAATSENILDSVAGATVTLSQL